jgi:hypothetical protein
METGAWTRPAGPSPVVRPSRAMPEPLPQPELLRSLGRLVRGLSALFWGLPLALIVCFHTAMSRSQPFKFYGFLPPMITTGLLAYGLWQLGDFQKQERVWRTALDRARILSLVNFGLSPFLDWWNKVPSNTFFTISVLALICSAVLFLGSLNLVLQRLGAMLPDEALRVETRQFTALNLNLLGATLVLVLIYIGASRLTTVPIWLGTALTVVEHASPWFLIVLVLLPLAMTMALLWKTKQVIFENVFGTER